MQFYVYAIHKEKNHCFGAYPDFREADAAARPMRSTRNRLGDNYFITILQAPNEAEAERIADERRDDRMRRYGALSL